MFFWGGRCRQGDRCMLSARLILMGDWCDCFATKYRKNGSEKLYCKGQKTELRLDEIEAPGIALST